MKFVKVSFAKAALLSFILMLLSLAEILYCFFFFSPHDAIFIGTTALPVIALMYTCIFLFCTFFFKLLTHRLIHGVSIGIFICSFLVLKTNHLLQPFLLILLLILILALEFAFWPKRNS